MTLIDDYIIEHSEKEPDLLKEIYRETYLNFTNPQMCSGHLQGLTLSLLSQMIKPSAILEIGTFTGYSTICLSKGLSENGIIYSIDINDELETTLNYNFKKAGISKSVKLFFGDACKIIPTIKTNFDLVFIDADKRQYLEYYNLVFDKINKGGFIIADNVLWGGKVVLGDDKDPQTKGIIEFNKALKNDNRVEKVILPMRDGLMLICKK